MSWGPYLWANGEKPRADGFRLVLADFMETDQMHESPAGQTLGSTMCVNPGSEYGEGILRGAIVDLAEDGEIKRWQITQG